MKKNVIDITGLKFGRLTAIKYIGQGRDNRAMWECKCDCGKTKITAGSFLRNGNCQSCGCLVGQKITKHGMSHSKNQISTRTYQSWNSARGRCLNVNDKNYHNYGGRGIKFAEKWNDFMVFLLDMGECPDKYELDRIDPNGNYEPANCRWTDNRTQANNRRNTIYYDLDGQHLSGYEIEKKTGVPINYLRSHVKDGYAASEAIIKYHTCHNKKERYRGVNSKATKYSETCIKLAIELYNAVSNVGTRKPKGTIEAISQKTGIKPDYVKRIMRGKTNWYTPTL